MRRAYEASTRDWLEVDKWAAVAGVAQAGELAVEHG